MRRLICGWLMMTLVAPVWAGFSSADEVSQWLTSYYQDPQPAMVSEAIAYMGDSGMLDQDGVIAPIAGFLAGWFRDHPAQATDWANRHDSLSDPHLATIVLGIWYADLPESPDLAQTLLEQSPKLKSAMEQMFKGSPMMVEAIPLEQGPWVLDMLWGNFMATGNREPVVRIMAALPWVDVEGDIHRLLIGGAARWSLTSNAIQHERVLQICESEVEAQPEAIALKLREIIEQAHAQRNHSGISQPAPG